MSKKTYFYFKAAALLVLLISTLINLSCTLEIIPENSKVIVTHLGEVINDTKDAGEIATYKIYYTNTAKVKAYVRIVDKLDQGLSDVKVLNPGKYFSNEHLIVWDLGVIGAGKKGTVEFTAKVGDSGVIKNSALIQIGSKEQINKFDPKKPIKPADKIIIAPDKIISRLSKLVEIKTNVVETIICASPKLGWIPFIPDIKQGEVPQAIMKDETTSGNMVNFNIPGMFVREVKREGVKYHRLSMPGKGSLENIGQPELPILGQIIEVPKGVSLSLEIVKTKSIDLECYNVYPAQEPEPDTNTIPPTFTINKAAYLSNKLYPLV